MLRLRSWLLLLVFALAACVAEKDFYAILGVDRDATDQQIKRSFRKLSLKYHPDKNKDDEEAQKKFLELNEAYEVLNNEEKKHIYDTQGEEGLKPSNQRRGGGSPFDMFFGGGGQDNSNKGPDFNVDFKVTLEELYNGEEKSFDINRNVVCKKCRGTGAKDGETKKCGTCKGKGVVMKMQQLGPGFNVQMQQPCDKCRGKGVTFKKKCETCRGHKVVKEDKELNAEIEKGMPDGEELRFERASEQSPDTVPGDVVLKIKTEKHPRFTRHGDDLHYTLTISLKESLLGFTKSVKQLDGRDVEIKREDKLTPHDYVITIKDEGMPLHNFSSEKGKMLVKIKVKFPTTLSKAQQEAIEKALS